MNRIIEVLTRAITIVVLAGGVQAATISVNSTDGGGVDINGNCSLAEATVAANFNVAVDDCASGSAVAEDLIVFEPLFSNGIGAVISMDSSLAIGPEDTRLFVPSNRFLVIEGAPDEQIFIWSFGGSGTLTLQGVTFRFGSATLAAGAGFGGQIEIRSDSGGGAGSLVIERSTFDRGLAESEGGAIGGVVVQENLDITISDSSFVDNRSLGAPLTYGGAVSLQVDNQGSVGVSIQGTEFISNEAKTGGAIQLDATNESSIDLAIENSTFETNSATSGGAIDADVDSESRFDVQIRSSIFDRNEANGGGGGLRFESDEAPGGFNPVTRVNSLLIEDSLFKSNVAGFNSTFFQFGSALAVLHHSRGNINDETLVRLARNSFIDNWAQGRGAAYFENVASMRAENNLFIDNRSSLFTGGLVYSYADTESSDVVLVANSFHENLGGSGQADHAPYDLLISSQDTSFFFAMRGNVVNGLVPPSGRFNCVIDTPSAAGWNAALLGNTGSCAPGTDSLVVSDLLLDVISTGDPVHPTSVTPSVASPLVDSWPEFVCDDIDGAPLTADLIGDRRDPGTGLPFDGDGDGTEDCDIGAFERPATTLFELAVSLGGTGSGNVSSNPGGIDCPGDCSELYAGGTSVTLTASPDPGAAFDGWSGDCAGTGSCQVTMNQARSVTATFSQTLHPLTVSVSGDGQVSSFPAGIACPGDCSEDYAEGTVVTMSATPDAGFSFDGWSGDCSGTGLCQVTMDQARSVTASFIQILQPLTVQVSGDGAVRSTPAGIDCPADCSQSYADGTLVELTPLPGSGFIFDGWSGDCIGSGACQVTMDQARLVRASFSQGPRLLTVQVSGSGEVASSPAGIACPGDCSEDYSQGTVVTLSQTADPGFAFDGWSGDCTGTGACQVTMDQARSVTAAFSQIVHPLTVQVNGNGQVTSAPTGIDCPGDCSEDYAEGTLVELTPTADAGFTFDGWSGDCSGTGSCQVTMDQVRSVTAAFSQIVHPLTVQVSGSGSVTSSPAGIACPGDCSEDYAEGTVVSLSSSADPGFTFDGWSGDCTGTGACQVTMDQARSVTAAFSQIVHPLTVQVTGDGQATSAPTGIDCPGDCSEDYAEGTLVELTPTADAGFTFDGWSGDCSGTGSCQVTMDQVRSVTAAFSQIVHPLTVQVSGSGSVTSSPAGINCPGDCAEDYAQGTAVTLSATPDAGFSFAGWSGDCSGTGSCQVTMDQVRSVTATFALAVTTYQVDVEIVGNGIGAVMSGPAGIDCPADCSEAFEDGTAIALTPIAGGTSEFLGWRADCASFGTAVCQLTVDQAYRAIAIFGDGDLLFFDGFE